MGELELEAAADFWGADGLGELEEEEAAPDRPTSAATANANPLKYIPEQHKEKTDGVVGLFVV
jgi:hypothetical protein